jgi:hypothetical protein
VLQAKFGFTVENIVATARIQLGLEHDSDPPGITLETSETAEAQAKGTSGFKLKLPDRNLGLDCPVDGHTGRRRLGPCG